MAAEARIRLPGYYKVCAVSRAAGILSARKKSLRRGKRARDPYSLRPVLTAYQGFHIKNGELRIPLGGRRFESIPLTKHTLSFLSNPALTVRSFTLTSTCLSICVSRDVPELECTCTVGIDRNLRNLTVGNDHGVVRYDLSETVRIAETTTSIIRSFRRDDVRVRTGLTSKYGRRRHNRIQQLLQKVTKQIVEDAVENKEAVVLENISGIRRLYCKGNGQGRNYRRRMNGWSFSEAQRQIEYKARWVGLPVIRLSRRETRGSSITCPRCGERLQEDKSLKRKLWCSKCRVVMDRDGVAAVNLSRRGRLRFDRSRAHDYGLQGGAVEAVKGNPTTMVIPRVDAPKSDLSLDPEGRRPDRIVKVTRKFRT
jgi:putative transposase